jgi:hypothetical protein
MIKVTIALQVLLAVCAAQFQERTAFVGDNSMLEASRIPNNSAVHWDGTRFGLVPTLSTEAETIVAAGQSAVPALLDALTDPNSFVTAHVLLTRITRVQHETFPSWNGLKVDLRATNEVEIDPEQRHRLADQWKRYFQTTPRPTTLRPAPTKDR